MTLQVTGVSVAVKSRMHAKLLPQQVELLWFKMGVWKVLELLNAAHKQNLKLLLCGSMWVWREKFGCYCFWNLIRKYLRIIWVKIQLPKHFHSSGNDKQSLRCHLWKKNRANTPQRKESVEKDSGSENMENNEKPKILSPPIIGIGTDSLFALLFKNKVNMSPPIHHLKNDN